MSSILTWVVQTSRDNGQCQAQVLVISSVSVMLTTSLICLMNKHANFVFVPYLWLRLVMDHRVDVFD